MAQTSTIQRPLSKPKPLWRQPSKWIAGYLFAAPAITLLILFSVISIAVSLYLSFFDYDIIRRGGPFVGLDNYREALFEDDLFWTAMRNTAFYAIGVVPGITITAFLLALAGHKATTGKGFFRTVYFLPSITPIVVISLIWVWLYSPEGMFNQMLDTIGIQGPNWLMDPRTAMPSVIIMSVWVHVGYYVVIYLAGLADIPSDFYDAAKVDGANAWRRFFHVTIPMLTPTIFFVVILSIIASYQVFTNAFVMTEGGPGSATLMLVLLLYRVAFEQFKFGFASAIAWLIFAIIMVFTLLVIRSSSFWVYYAGEEQG